MSFFRIALLLFIPATAFAAPSRTCRILFLQPPADAPEKLQLFDGTECREVELPHMNLSRIYELPGGAIKLRMLSAAPADLTNIPEAAPSVTVPETMSNLYLLVTGDPANFIAPVRMQVVDAGNDKIRRGQSLWFNLSPNAVNGTLGKVNLSIAAGAREVVEAPADGAGQFPVNLNFRIPGDQQNFPLCQARWRHDPHSRSLVFILAQPGRRSPKVMSFTDHRPPERRDQDR